jgi:hypothetical protein
MFHPIVGAKVPSRVGAGVAGMLGGGACAALGAFRARALLGRRVGTLASPWVECYSASLLWWNQQLIQGGGDMIGFSG